MKLSSHIWGWGVIKNDKRRIVHPQGEVTRTLSPTGKAPEKKRDRKKKQEKDRSPSGPGKREGGNGTKKINV